MESCHESNETNSYSPKNRIKLSKDNQHIRENHDLMKYSLRPLRYLPRRESQLATVKQTLYCF